MGFVFVFFKQKTAYEMRISDWSSDVCSSDLIFTGSSDLALLAASAQARIDVWPNQVRAVGTRPVFFLIASTNSLTCGTLGWFQYHSITQLPIREPGDSASCVSSSMFAPAIWNRLSLPQIGRASCWERVVQD